MALLVLSAALLLGACGAVAQDVPEQLVDAPPPTIAQAAQTIAPVTATPAPTATYPPDLLQGVTVALDAGHGGADEGARGFCVDTEVLEVDVNLRTRELLSELLVAVGAEVYFVPQPPDREERVRAAEAAGADILLSIHHNGYFDTDLNYTATFVSDDADMLLASYVHSQLVDALALPNSEIQYEEFGMTSIGSVPAILTEATFITNDVEACNFLRSQSRITAEARALFEGIIAYFLAEGVPGS